MFCLSCLWCGGGVSHWCVHFDRQFMSFLIECNLEAYYTRGPDLIPDSPV